MLAAHAASWVWSTGASGKLGTDVSGLVKSNMSNAVPFALGDGERGQPPNRASMNRKMLVWIGCTSCETQPRFAYGEITH